MTRQRLWAWSWLAALPWLVMAQTPAPAPNVLPATATTALHSSLAAATAHVTHLWRDNAPINDDDTVNLFVEISRGDRRKWEFDMRAARRVIDRVMPVDVGGYPVNYGFVPQTVSYDGDPFDGLVLGPPLEGGRMVRGVIVGLMQMEDEKGLDSKVVLSPAGPDGRPVHRLTPARQDEIGEYFRRYKRHETGKFSTVPGWGSAVEGLMFVRMTHAFFQDCQQRAGQSCRVERETQTKSMR